MDDNTPAEIREEAARLGLPDMFYIDRYDDADAMLPWGFDGTLIDGNQATGLANANYLMQNEQGVANTYRPYGKANGGSAIMHAAFSKYYQRNDATGIVLNPTLDEIINYNAQPAGYPRNFFVPSVDEWKLLEMLDKSGVEVYDRMYPLTPWDPYWTSDAVEGSDAESYTYRIGQSEANAVGTLPRTTSAKYRMIYY
jgi:hypothetical protein